MKIILKNIEIIRLLFSMDKRPILICTACVLLENAERILRILLPSVVITYILEQSEEITYARTGVIILMIALFSLITRVFRGFLSPLSFRCSNLVQTKLREKLMKLSLEYSESKELFDDYNLVDSTFYKFMDTGYVFIVDFLGGVLSFAVMAVILCKVNFLVFLLAFIVSVFVYYIGKDEAKKLHAFEESKKELLSQRKCYLDMLYDMDKMKEIKLFQAGELISEDYCNITSRIVDIDAAKEKYSFKLKVKRGIVAFLQEVVIYLNAIWKYMAKEISLGIVYILISAGEELVESVKEIIDAFNSLRSNTLYYEDFSNYMRKNEEFYTDESVIPIDQIEMIEFKNVSFKYKAMDSYALRNINCVFKKGEKVALLGENGAGKTTFVKLLLRLYDVTEGEILVNGINIKKYKYDEYLNAISAVFQETELTAYSIQENIVIDRENIEEKLKQVCEISGILPRIQNLEKGFESIVSKDLSEEGIEFSGGERQKIAISRALYRNTNVVVLDEPTSALDAIAENQLFVNVDKFCKDKLIIYITHRISNVSFCNKILLFVNGSLHAQGNHSDMILSCDEYRDMFEKQASYYL